VSTAITLPYAKRTLPNGLDVIVHEDRRVPIVAVNLWYHVGSKNERSGRTGFAHLFEHLMFEGSGHVKEGEFDMLLEAAGATNNGSTETDRTNYYIDLPSNALAGATRGAATPARTARAIRAEARVLMIVSHLSVGSCATFGWLRGPCS